MRRLFMLFALAPALCLAQPPADSRPATSNVPNAEYPRVYSDLRVTFRIEAPEARKVQLVPGMGRVENNGYNGLGKDPYDMVRDEKGVWTVTTPWG